MKGFSMKKTRFMRTLALLLTLVIALGMAVGVSAATEANDGSLEVIAKNVEYEAELSLVFAVDSANKEPGDEVYLLIWNAEHAEGDYTLANADSKKESYGTAATEINGYANALLFKTDKIAVDNLQHKFYIRTCIVRGGEEIYGEVFTYSVEDYALQRLSEDDVTADQAELYYNVLRYALAADKVLNPEDAQVEDNYVIFAADGMTFGEDGAKLATMYGDVVPFDKAACTVKNAAGVVVEVTDALEPGIYTVSPAN